LWTKSQKSKTLGITYLFFKKKKKKKKEAKLRFLQYLNVFLKITFSNST
jgi:hypothetical protein